MTGAEGDISTQPSDTTGGLAAIRRSLRFVLLCVASATVAGLLIAYAADDKGYGRYRPWISEKLAVLESRPPVPNAIFIGASITLRSIIPSEVDAAAAAAGCEGVHSINIGMPGAKQYETAFMLDRVLDASDLQPGSFVIFDVLSSGQFDYEDIAASERAPVAARLRYAPDLIASTRPSRGDVLRLLAYFRAALGEALGFHALSDIAMQNWRQDQQFDNARVTAKGYVSLEAEEAKKKRREQFLEKGLVQHGEELREWRVEDFEGDRLPSNPFADRIRRAGHVPIAYAAPFRSARLAAAVLRAQAVDPGLGAIAITRENAPEIYAGSELWFDRGHVTEAGAKLVSSIVGRALCSIAKSS